MGVDEALLATAARGGTPTLRFYTWRGPWLSLGYAQRVEPALPAACAAAEVGLVRRVTGGLAVLHGADLTYAVAAHESDLPAGLRASYALVAGALVSGLRSLGVEALRAPALADDARPRRFDCFAEAAGDEIGVDGRKLAGSAQRRAGGGVLQHGSLRLSPDCARASRAAGVGEGATSLRELGVEAGERRVREVCLEHLREALDARLVEGELSGAERCWAEERSRRHPKAPLEAPPRSFPWGSQGG